MVSLNQTGGTDAGGPSHRHCGGGATGWDASGHLHYELIHHRLCVHGMTLLSNPA